MRTFIAAAAVFAIGFGIALADDVRGIIKSVDGDKLVITKKGKKGAKDEDVTYVIPASAKITKAINVGKDTKRTKADDNALEGGLKNEAVKIGAGVTVTVEDDKVTAVMISAFARKKKTE